MKVGGSSAGALKPEDSTLREERYGDHGHGSGAEMRQSELQSKIPMNKNTQIKIKKRQVLDTNHDLALPEPPEASHSRQKRMFTDKSVTQIPGPSTSGLGELAANQSKNHLEERNPLARIGS